MEVYLVNLLERQSIAIRLLVKQEMMQCTQKPKDSFLNRRAMDKLETRVGYQVQQFTFTVALLTNLCQWVGQRSKNDILKTKALA